jgi:MoxR-like ATPase
VEYPSLAKELSIVRAKVPGIDARLAGQVAAFVQGVRRQKLAKVPGVAETLDWAHALVALHADELDGDIVTETLGCFLKDEADMRHLTAEIAMRGVGALIAEGAGAA